MGPVVVDGYLMTLIGRHARKDLRRDRHNEVMKRRINVVGAAIVKDGMVLCLRRGPDGSLPGMWEFPGGKIEPGDVGDA
jgi:8-oxo-dGTP pyrophosphatase MutT (NUDIX family)